MLNAMSRRRWTPTLVVIVILSMAGPVPANRAFAAAPVERTPISNPNDEKTDGGLDPRIVEIMNSAPYRYGEWGLHQINPATGRIVHSLAPAQRLFVHGSTTKLFSVSAGLDDLGFDHRFTTPVYALGHKNAGSLDGDLVLVAQGDLTMGGR